MGEFRALNFKNRTTWMKKRAREAASKVVVGIQKMEPDNQHKAGSIDLSG